MSSLGKNWQIAASRILAILSMAAAFAGSTRPLGAQPTTALSPWVAADFDGDCKPDFARAGAFRPQGFGFVQEINLGFSAVQAGTFLVHTPVVGYRLVARDVDGDSDWDLVLESLSREPVAILLNDGGGRFHQVDVDAFRHLFPKNERTSFEAPGIPSPHILNGWAPPNAAVIPHPRDARLDAISPRPAEFGPVLTTTPALSGAYTRGPPSVS